MSILIIGRQLDVHVDAVIWGLKHFDVSVTLFDPTQFPFRDNCNLSINPDGSISLFIEINGVKISSPFDAIWHRRRPNPNPMKNSFAGDRKIITRESQSYIDNMILFLGHQSTLHVNSVDAESFAQKKAHQLVVAQRVGFRIPQTIIGNNYRSVVDFFETHPHGMIYKAFHSGGWIKDETTAVVLRTSAIHHEHLEFEDVIQGCPGIFQELIEKEYELRVTVIGNSVLAGKIDSQKNSESVDWRYDGRLGHIELSEIDLPRDVEQKCLTLCRELGLVFACIDLIVDKNGSVIFLEINPMGQFLWKEAIEPRIELLDTFCRFLLQDFALQSEKPTLRFADYLKSDDYQHLISSEQPKFVMEDSIFSDD